MRFLIPLVIICLLASAIALLCSLILDGIAAGGGPMHTGFMGWAYDYQTLLAGLFVVSGAFLAFAGTLRSTYLAETDDLAKKAVMRSKVHEEAIRLHFSAAHHIERAKLLKPDTSGEPLTIKMIEALPKIIQEREGDVRALGVRTLYLLGGTIGDLRQFNDFVNEVTQSPYSAVSDTGYPAGEILETKGGVTWERNETAAESYTRVAQALQRSSLELLKATSGATLMQRTLRKVSWKLKKMKRVV